MKNLKILILGLFCLFGLISFSNAGSLIYTGSVSVSNYPAGSQTSNILFDFGIPNSVVNSTVSIDCSFFNISDIDSDFKIKYKSYLLKGLTYFPNPNGTYDLKANNYHLSFERDDLVGLIVYNGVSSFTNSFDYSCVVSGSNLNIPSCPLCQECETCHEVDTGAILSGYIAISDITDNYCISNGLCGEISTGLSTLYINDIRHESKPFIYVNIPEEFDWDYTGDIAEINIDVKGYNTDTDYINNVISSQISKPTKQDFGNLINVVAKFVPGLVIILFVYFIFRFIKKIF